jgi:hypothetical protein
MDPKSEAIVQVLQQSVAVIEQARTEQGWTAGAVALVLLVAIVGLGWMVRRLCLQVDEFNTWRNAVMQGQVETTTRALDSAATGMDKFGQRIDQAAQAVRENTAAVLAVKDAIREAPCGVRMV